MTGDRNPIHLVEHAADRTGTRIALVLHGERSGAWTCSDRAPSPSQTQFRAGQDWDTALTVMVAELLRNRGAPGPPAEWMRTRPDGEAVVKVPLRAKMRGQKWKRERIPRCVPGVGEADKDQEVGIKTLRSPSGGPSLAKP